MNDKGHVFDLKLTVGTVMCGGGIVTVKVTQNALGIVQRKHHCHLKGHYSILEAGDVMKGKSL